MQLRCLCRCGTAGPAIVIHFGQFVELLCVSLPWLNMAGMDKVFPRSQ